MEGLEVNEILTKFRYPFLILLVGLILIGGGFFFLKSGLSGNGTKVEVLSATDTNAGPGSQQGLTVEITGEVIKPGVYKLPNDSRVDDLLIAAGGFSIKADREWTDKYLNRAAKLIDAQKVYIPRTGEQSNTVTANKVVRDQTISSPNISDSSKLININTASLEQLDSLPGIGQVYGNNIVEHRPYSTTAELVSKGAIKQSLYDKIKNLISIY